MDRRSDVRDFLASRRSPGRGGLVGDGLTTVASLVTSGSVEQLVGHLQRPKDNGLTEIELKEAIIHLAFYAGWPKAMSAIEAAKRVFAE